MKTSSKRCVGASVARVDAFEKLTGAARYVDDLTRPGLLHAVTLRSSVAAVGLSWVKTPYEGYQLTNLGARIRADRERITQIQRRAARTECAAAWGGVVVEGDA